MSDQAGGAPRDEPLPVDNAASPVPSETRADALPPLRQADLLEQMPQAVAIWQLDGRILYWNRGAEQLYGYPRGQALGRDVHTLLRTHHPLSLHYVRDILTRTGQWTGELHNRTADDRPVTIESRMVLLARTDDPPCVLETGCDITQQRHIQEQLAGRNQALEQRVAELAGQVRTLAGQLSVAQQQATRQVAHQMHDLLQQCLVAGKLRPSGAAGERQADNLDRFLQQLDDLLDLASDPRQSLATQVSPPILHHGSLSQILQWLARWMQENHSLAVQVNADEQANPRLPEVRTAVFHAVRELLFNVIRHAGVRRATVTLVPGPDRAQVAVADDGSGFDPQHVQERQGAAQTGLSDVRRRMREVGGSLEVQSTPGKGTLAVIEAPLGLDVPPVGEHGAGTDVAWREDMAETVGLAPAAGGAANAPKIRVLLADDHAVVRDGLRRLLQMQPDIEVVAQAADGLEAVDLALQLKPDVIVLDTNMPRLNGIQAARRILTHLPHARIIGLSMYTASDMDLAMRQAGACEYLTKTASPENVVTAVRSCIAK